MSLHSPTRKSRTRWVHVRPDGSEQDFDFEPSDEPTICVTAEYQTDPRWIDETTRTYFNVVNDINEPAPPPGKGWVQGLKTRTGHWWYRRRWL